MIPIRTAAAALLAWLVMTPPHLAAQEAPLEGLDAYIEAAVSAWDVPALAIAVVKDDRVVFARGFGTLGQGEHQAVDEHTIFGIGSTTKAFTAAALALLVDEGRLQWDDELVDLLPNFRLYDPYATANITVRDLLSHTSGLSRGDRMWYTRDFDRAEVVRRVRYQKPTWTLRQRYGYSNTMFTAAGLVVEAITGKAWDAFVAERFFRPLGMTRTSTTIRGLDTVSNVAASYTSVGARSVAIPRWNQDNIGPAGSINSTVADLAQWVRFQLGEGTSEGDSLLSVELVREMHSPQVVVGGENSTVLPPPEFDLYGLGWRIRDYHGRKVVYHGGGGHGVSAQVALIPEEELGVVVLTNVDGQSLPTALVYRVFDAYLGVSQRDWSALFLAARDESLARAAEREERLAGERVQGTRPSQPLDAYVGEYWHPYYGTAEVSSVEGRLYLRFVSDIYGPLEHWHFDTFRADWEHPRYGSNFVTFLLDADGQVAAIRIPPEWDTSILVDFERLPADGDAPNGSRGGP